MARLDLSLDTKDNVLSVKVDGTEVSEVSSVSVYNGTDWDGEQSMTFSVSSYTKNDGVRTCLTICAKELDEKPTYDVDKLRSSIEAYMNKKSA